MRGIDTPKPRPQVIEGPLEIEGTVGPETHEYGSTAVHWYQRER